MAEKQQKNQWYWLSYGSMCYHLFSYALIFLFYRYNVLVKKLKILLMSRWSSYPSCLLNPTLVSVKGVKNILKCTKPQLGLFTEIIHKNIKEKHPLYINWGTFEKM